MDKKNLRKTLYYLSLNCRLTTKKLGKYLRRSQQIASYLVRNIEEKGIIRGYRAVADPARLGLTNVIVLYNYTSFDEEKIKILHEDLIKIPSVITVDQLSQGGDLLVEYSVPNLSFFNKKHRGILYKYRSVITVGQIHVVVVKHIYQRKYLLDKPDFDEAIICGDRNIFALKVRQKKVISELHSYAKDPIIKIAAKMKLDPKTVVLLKKHLEFREIILKYTASLDYSKAGIRRGYILLETAQEDPEAINKIIMFTKTHKNIVRSTKTIGKYSLLLVTESFDPDTDVIRDIRKKFLIKNYKTIISENVMKEDYIPADI